VSTLFSEKSIGRAIFVRIGLMLITPPIKVLVYSPVNGVQFGCLGCRDS